VLEKAVHLSGLS